MSTLLREPNAQPLLQFVTPYGGTWSSIAANVLTPDQLYQSMNVFIRSGRLQNRPGLELLKNSFFDDEIIGGSMVVTPSKRIMLAFSPTTVYRLDNASGEWRVEDARIPIGSRDYFVDTCFLETSNDYVCIVANGISPLYKWVDGQGITTINSTAGVVPTAQSICTSASRIIALINNHTIRWSNSLTFDGWPALNYSKKPAETNDEGICVRALGSYDFVVYKERSIYIARAQGGADARAFAMQLVQQVEGPAGIRAVVDIGGIHMYMSDTGRVGTFDGTSYVQWVADGLWFFLQDDIDQRYSSDILGIFDYRLHAVTFYYPRNGDEGKLRGMVIINLPLAGSGITNYTCFLGESIYGITHGYEMHFDNEVPRSILFTSPPAQSCVLNERYNLDIDRPFKCSFQTGLLPLTDMKHYRVSFEVFLERAAGNGFVNVRGVVSDVLEGSSGSIGSNFELINLEFNPVREYIGLNQTCRFAGLQFTWPSSSIVRYVGAIVYGVMVN